MKKRQGFEMWQRAMDKSDHSKTMSMSLPLSLKDSANRQSCAAVPFTQVRQTFQFWLTMTQMV